MIYKVKKLISKKISSEKSISWMMDQEEVREGLTSCGSIN